MSDFKSVLENFIKKKLIVPKKEVNPGRNELPSKLSNFSNGRLENKTLK